MGAASWLLPRSAHGPTASGPPAPAPPPPLPCSVELASFHTVSKGVLGECGLRGGYVELTNFHPGTVDELYKVRWGWGWGGWMAVLRQVGARSWRVGQAQPNAPLTPPHPIRPPAPSCQAVSINLSPNTMGQVTMSLMVNPPQPGSESYAQWQREHDEGLASLRRRAHAMTDGFNALDGVTCTFTEGAM